MKAPFLTEECNLPVLFQDGKSELYRGDVQSGKSIVMFCLSLFSLCQKKNVVVVLCDLTKDFKQFERGFHVFIAEFCLFLESRGVTSFKPIEVAGMTRPSKKMGEWMRAYQCVNVCMANKSQLSKVVPFLEENGYTLIIDEADAIAYSSGKYSEYLSQLQTRAFKTYEVTATSFKCLLSDTSPSADHIHLLPRPSNYKGVESVEYIPLDDPEPFYARRMRESPFRKGTYGLAEDHPIIILHKTSVLHTEHAEVFEYVRVRGFTTILFNSDGIWLADSSLPSSSIEIHGRVSTFQQKHVFTKLMIQHVLQYLKENGGAERFPRIVIISGMLASRGTNFTSTDFGWHLTHEYYLPAKHTDTAKLVQSMRIYGVYADTIPLRCYTTPSVIADIHKSVLLELDAIQRFLNSKKDTSARTMLSEEFTFYTKKIPKRRLIDTAYPALRTTSSKNDGGCNYIPPPPLDPEPEFETLEINEEEEDEIKYIPFEGLSKAHTNHYATFRDEYVKGKYEGWQERTLVETISQQSAWHFFQKAVPVSGITKKGLYVKQDADKTWWFRFV